MNTSIKADRIHSTLETLANIQGKDLPPKLFYAVLKTTAELQKEQAHVQKMISEKAKAYAKREDGKIVWKKDKEGKDLEGRPVIEDEKAYEEAIEAIADSEVHFEAHQIPLSVAIESGLPPALFAAIDFMIKED